MEDLSKYLGEILTSREHVCLPGIGGFISKQVSAAIDPGTHIYTPPHKQIAFNERLEDEGEVLAEYLSGKLQISREDANAKIEAYVSRIKEFLSEDAEFNVPGIGYFYRQDNGATGFKTNVSPALDPVNFGLPQILVKIPVTEKSNKFLQKPKDRKAMSSTELQTVPDPGSPGDNPVRSETSNERKNYSLTWLYIITPLILIGGLGLFLGSTDDGKKVLANMHLLQTAPMPVDSAFEESAEKHDDVLTENEALKETAPTESFDNAASAEETIKKTETQAWVEEPVKSKQEEIAKTDAPVLATANLINGKSGRSFIIAGGFTNKRNAVKLREKLIHEGLESKIIAPFAPANLYRVSLGDYADKETAFRKAEELKASYGEQIWVMVY